MKPEVYPDQFTPWIRNHLIDEVAIPIDILGGALLGNLMAQDPEGLTCTSNLIYSALVTNYYLDWFSSPQKEPEAE